ncbi:hypothetical protein [Rossellomorea sp. SC111]|uniref:hypothetical protein n=1 Tax=Rossellomorea sp. SC111 TaxID=2968985 RepID=UPI00215B0DDE|nr:hypothetical protein [Rossellomorea sp. SC111]
MYRSRLILHTNKVIVVEGAQLTPRGKRAPEVEINHYSLPYIATKFTKRAILIKGVPEMNVE